MSEGRAEKLVRLSEYMDLETGTLYEEKFQDEVELLEKSIQMKVLASKIRQCNKCPGLNVKRLTECVPGWGNLNADVVFVGQSLHGPGMVSGVPFVGGSGLLIIAALRLSSLSRQDCFWTNVVHCHPENNRTSTEREKRNCFRWLMDELLIVRPKLVVAMGNDAKEAIDLVETSHIIARPFDDPPKKILKLKHPAAVLRDGIPEQVNDWIVKLSIEIDNALNPDRKKPKTKK